MIAHLAEFESRRLFLELGFSSLYTYCREALGWSKDTAYKRSRVARLALVRPDVVELLEAGDVSVSALLAVARCPDLVDDAVGKSKREVEAMVAARFPDAAAPRGDVLSDRARELLDEALALTAHSGASASDVIEEALADFVAKKKKQRFAVTDSPRASRGADGIAAETKREVFTRDGGQCTWLAPSGRRCSEQSMLEIDHVQPKAKDGDNSLGNLRLLCHPHNQLEAERAFGHAHMAAARVKRDATSALRNLGFDSKTSDRAVATAARGGADFDSVVRAALRSLAPG